MRIYHIKVYTSNKSRQLNQEYPIMANSDDEAHKKLYKFQNQYSGNYEYMELCYNGNIVYSTQKHDEFQYFLSFLSLINKLKSRNG